MNKIYKIKIKIAPCKYKQGAGTEIEVYVLGMITNEKIFLLAPFSLWRSNGDFSHNPIPFPS
ncbi:MAG: hypothetical protein KAV41_01830 [Candidatus Pacebacteria bacterium]|nr:hypothetical protein [Candidatus Paceibacterota bacterium]